MGKGIVSGAIGLLISTIGIDPNAGVPRFTFGSYSLIQGISVIPCMIGLFSFSQVLFLIGTDKTFVADYNPRPGTFKRTAAYLAGRCKKILLRSSLIGTWVGMLPGAGGEIASIIAYNESKRWAKNPSVYGTGCIEGVASSESANNAVIGGSLIPMATLAQARGLAGFVIDGAVRDSDALRGIGFPVYARGVSPNGPYKDACGEINVPVAIGNIVIAPGDIIAADGDGIVAIRKDEAETVAGEALKIAEKGLQQLAKIKKGVKLDYSWLYERLEKTSCRML